MREVNEASDVTLQDVLDAAYEFLQPLATDDGKQYGAVIGRCATFAHANTMAKYASWGLTRSTRQVV